MIKYAEMVKNTTLDAFDSQKVTAKGQDMTETNNMETTGINWDSALAGSGKYVTFEEGKRVTIVAKNPEFSEVQKTFKGQEEKTYVELKLTVVEEADIECDKELTTISKRFMTGLRPLFENAAVDQEIRFSVKKIGKDTDTNYDVELVK